MCFGDQGGVRLPSTTFVVNTVMMNDSQYDVPEKESCVKGGGFESHLAQTVRRLGCQRRSGKM